MSEDLVPRDSVPDGAVPHAAEAHEQEVLHRASIDHRFRRELEEWRDAAIAAEIETGHHEETVEQAKTHIALRIGRMSLGAVLVLLGLAMLLLPGPGLLCIAAGLALLAQDVPFADRWLRRVRKRLPAGEDGELSKGFIIGCCVGGAVLLGASVWFTWFRGDLDIAYIPLI